MSRRRPVPTPAPALEQRCTGASEPTPLPADWREQLDAVQREMAALIAADGAEFGWLILGAFATLADRWFNQRGGRLTCPTHGPTAAYTLASTRPHEPVTGLVSWLREHWECRA